MTPAQLDDALDSLRVAILLAMEFLSAASCISSRRQEDGRNNQREFRETEEVFDTFHVATDMYFTMHLQRAKDMAKREEVRVYGEWDTALKAAFLPPTSGKMAKKVDEPGRGEDTESDNDADAEHKAADAADDELNAAKLLKNC